MDLINILFAKALNNGDATKEYVDEAIKALKGEVNADLDTLEELSKALGNDPDFFLTVKNEIDGFKTELVTNKDTATENTRFAIGTAEQTLEVPSMEEFNQLRDGKLNEPAEGLAVGKYFRVAALDENGHAVLEAVDANDVGVQDVQVDGESIVTDGVANAKLYAESFGMNSSGIYLRNANNTQITARKANVAVACINTDYAVKAAMCDGKGAAWTAEEQAAARERMGCYNGFTVLMDEVISEEAQNIYFVLPSNASEFIAYFESYNTAVPYTGSPYLMFDNAGNVNPILTMYSYFGATIKAGDMNIKGIQKCVIINDEDVCVEYAAVSSNSETTNQSQTRSGRVGIAKRTSNKIRFHFTDQSFPIGTRFLVLVRCK